MITRELRDILRQTNIYSPETEATIITKAGEEILITSSDLLGSIEVEQTALSPSGSPVGGLATGEIKVSLKVFDGQIDPKFNLESLRSIKFKMTFDGDAYTGVEYNSGIYEIDKVEFDEQGLEAIITGYDPVFKLNTEYVDPIGEYPVSAAEWVNAFSSKYGINIDAGNLIFIDEIIQKPNVDNMSAKQVLAKFLEWNFAGGSYSSGSLVCKTLDLEPTTFDHGEYNLLERWHIREYSTKLNQLGTNGFNTITLALSEDITSENFSSSDELMVAEEGREIELRLSDNPFLPDYNSYVKYAPLILEAAKGFNYEAYEMESTLIYLRPLEVIVGGSFNSLREGDYSMPIYTYHMVYDGSLSVKHTAPPIDSSETEYKWKFVKPSRKTEIKVDKLEGQITAIVEEVETTKTEVSRQAADLVIEKDRIGSLVESTTGSLDEFGQSLDTIESNMTSLEQKSNRFDLVVKHTNGANLLKNSVMFNGEEFWDHESTLKGQTNSWSLAKTSKQCITGNGFNEQTVDIVPGQSYTIAYDFLKQSQAGTLKVYYKINNQEVVLTEESGVLEESCFFHLDSIESGKITIGIEMEGVSLSQPSYIANLMLAKGEIIEWSPAIGEVYTLNVLIDELGIKVKNIDENTYTAMTPYEFAHYYDSEKVFSFDRQIANVQDLMVKGKTFEMEGGIKWINDQQSGKVILVNLRGER